MKMDDQNEPDAQATGPTAINQTINQTMDQTMLDQTVDQTVDDVKPPPVPTQMQFGEQKDAEPVIQEETSSKKYNQMRARWGNLGDNSASDFKFAPEVGNNDLTEKQKMSNAFEQMSAA